MAAYAALVSLMHIIDDIQHHPFPPISLHKQQVESLTEIVIFLQEFLQGYDSPVADADEADPLEMRIADAAYAAEDVIESNIVDQILPRGAKNDRSQEMGFLNCFRTMKEAENEKITSFDLHEGLQKVIEDMDLIKKEIVAEKAMVVEDQLPRQQVSTSTSLSRINSSSRSSSSLTRLNSTMVGFDDVCLEVMDKLTGGNPDRQVIPIVGMGGIGKTTLARDIYARPFIKDRFDVYAWATISKQYNVKEIILQLLSRANIVKNDGLNKLREDELGLALHKHLCGRRFLIVLDDMWSIEAWDKIQCYFPEFYNSSRILVTTRLSNLGSQLDNNYSLEMKCLDKDSSWILLSKIVFKEGSCPVELEKIGKKIVQNCRGLPLSIVVMGGLLEKLEHTKKCWENVMRNSNSLVNSENNEHCLKILKVSYNHLPVHLKPCFLYMGVFEEGSAILASKVIKLWVSEGFLRSENGKSLEIVARDCLKELIDRNLVRESELGSTGNVKYCRVHDLLRDVSLREAQKQRFYHVVGLHSPIGMYSQRRIVIPRSTSKKKVVDAFESFPHARSYISDHQSAPRMPNSRLLRVFEAYETHVYRSKRYVLSNMFELVNSRYQSVGAHRRVKLPSSINLLWNLQTLTVAHPRDVTAPVEIWKMYQLRHLHFCEKGLYLPNPPTDYINVVLENLQTLKGVRNLKCDDETVRRFPNMRKLGLIYDKGIIGLRGDYYCFGNLECLHKLESLSYKDDRLEGYADMITFPDSLRKLCLHVAVFVWQVAMEKIGSLPRLQKLKLISGQFRRGEWETAEGGFPSLKFLSLSCCLNLEYWNVESYSHFPCLEQLHLVALEKLKEIPAEIGEIATLRTIVLNSCSETALKSVKSIVEEQEELQGEDLSFKEFLQGYDSPVADADEADPLEMRIADAAYAAEDVIESNIVDQILPRGAKKDQSHEMGFLNCFRRMKQPKNESESEKITSLHEGLQKVIEEIDLIKKDIAASASLARRNRTLVVNSENDEHCLKMCYYHLPVHLKPCFLYMGVFEEQCTIRASIIIKLWVSEGFLKPIIGKSLETVAHEYLKELVDRNLILVHVLGSTGNVKYYKIRSLSRDLCLREAKKQRFYHVVGLHGPRGTCSHRRIVIPRGTSRKKVVAALESMPHARSYISDDESVQRLPNLRFLRIYESYDRYTNDRPRFELRNMFELVNSRYLNVGVHSRLELSSSISLLWNLQTLIVAHPRKVTAPVEIWKMYQLRHLHFCGKGLYLPDPPSDCIDVVLENLQTLKGVRNFKCDEEMVRRIPNVMKLGLKYDKDDGDKGIGFRGDCYCFGNFECLYKLESLSCKDNRLEDYLDMVTFPHSLKKLSLQAKLFVWQDVLEKIGSLPLLEKLTLLGGQFRRGEWETVEGRFLSLKSLKLVANLEYWRVESSSHFPCLERLYLGGLMEQIPAVVGHISTLQSIVLYRCSESVVKSAKRLVEEQEELQGEDLSLKVSVLLSEKNEALQSLANPNFQVSIT